MTKPVLLYCICAFPPYRFQNGLHGCCPCVARGRVPDLCSTRLKPTNRVPSRLESWRSRHTWRPRLRTGTPVEGKNSQIDTDSLDKGSSALRTRNLTNWQVMICTGGKHMSRTTRGQLPRSDPIPRGLRAWLCVPRQMQRIVADAGWNRCKPRNHKKTSEIHPWDSPAVSPKGVARCPGLACAPNTEAIAE